MLCFIALQGVRAHENVEHSQRREKHYIKGLKPCSRAFTTIRKQTKIMQNNVETQHKHMYSLYTSIGSLCNLVFPMARFT